LTTLTARVAGIIANGGATWAPDRDTPLTGFMVSLAGTERIIRANRFTEAILANFEQDHAERIAADQRLYYGAWLDAGVVYLDLSMHLPERIEALLAAQAEQQRAVFDLAASRTDFL